MTNTEIIQAIKAEIERRIHSIETCPFIEAEFGASVKRDGELIAYKDLLSFLDTLESEKPMQEGLEEELDRFIASGKSVTIEDCGTYKVSYHDFNKVARHFAEWGKEQGCREGFLEGTKIQQEEDNQLVDTIYQQGIEKGKDDMKEQMLKNAVEGEVYKFGEVAYVKERNNAELTKYLSQFNNGDKVKIIVIHETDIR